jgi:hypothetical protein
MEMLPNKKNNFRKAPDRIRTPMLYPQNNSSFRTYKYFFAFVRKVFSQSTTTKSSPIHFFFFSNIFYKVHELFSDKAMKAMGLASKL